MKCNDYVMKKNIFDRLCFTYRLQNIRSYTSAVINGWQLAKMKKSIPDMSLP